MGTLPTPTRSGHTFIGWFTAQTGGAQITANTIVPSSTTTYWARWQQNVTINLNANGGNVNPTSLSRAPGATMGTLPTPTRGGHAFVGWFTASTGGIQITESTIVPSGSVTYWARWTQNVTITFGANGGSVNPTTRTLRIGEPIGTLPIPTRAGFVFVGWFDTSVTTGGTQIASTTVVPNRNTTYWARWARTITFNANGGSVSPSSIDRVPGAPLGTLPTPTRSGFAFIGWFTTQTGGTQITAATNTPSNNTTYWARWGITITWNANGGSGGTSQNRVPGTSMGSLPTPTRSGYTFIGWFNTSASTGGTQITLSTIVPSSNTTYWARWQRTPITINLNANGGSVSPTSTSRTPGTTVGTLPTPTRSGHTFLGWFTAATGGTQITPNTIVPSTNVTYVARWTTTITWNANGGFVSPPSSSRNPGTAMGSLPTPSRSGRIFIGWFNTSATTGGTLTTQNTLVPHSNVTYWARWTDPARHLNFWSPSRVVNFRYVSTTQNPIDTTWRNAMNQGASNWATSAAPVSPSSNSTSNNRVTVENPAWTSFGRIYYRSTSGTSLNRFDIVMNRGSITTHATANRFNLNNIITSVFAHELGHAFGLRDGYAGSPLGGGNNGSIMNHGRVRNTVTRPTSFDITSVRILYDGF